MSTSKKKNEEEEEKIPKYIVKRYSERLSWLRQAQEYSQKDDVPRAVEAYMKYLNALGSYKGVKEEKLRPKHFDSKKDAAEMLLLSQVYWDLSKAYDRNPKLHREAERCLEQFVAFTVGFKYQYINHQMIRKFLKKGHAYNPRAFKKSEEAIRVSSKKCYVATYCFGPEHQVTRDLRTFKDALNKNLLGQELVSLYYCYSPYLVRFSMRHPFFGRGLKKFLLAPVLQIFSKLWRNLIM